jgi:GNAT superfamily N-acetyltransferase
MFSDLTLSRRLEKAEGSACRQFAAARRRLFPDCGSEWMEAAGACAVFDGVNSPVTQSFGLGIFEELSAESLDAFERFFQERKAPVHHEVSPLAGVQALELLCKRGYSPVELSSVMYRAVATVEQSGIAVRTVGPDEAAVWANVSARGWSHEHPELREFLEQRRRGLQAALMEARMRYAKEHGCDLAMMVAEPGSNSQRNAERMGFRIAYTRTKWRLGED